MIIVFFQLEHKRADEKSERDRLNDVYLELVEKQRAYYKRVKEFQDVSYCMHAAFDGDDPLPNL